MNKADLQIDRLQARVREDDTLIREHFAGVKKSDHAHELRRLVEKAIAIERKEKELLEEAKKQKEQDL